jgi:hypothetical protein
VKWLDPSVTQPHKIAVAPNGQTYDPYNTKPGVSFNDPNQAFGVGADGKAVPNAPYQAYQRGLKQLEQGPQWARLNFDREKLSSGIPDDQTLHDMAVRYVGGDRLAAGALGRNPRAQTAFQNMISQVVREQGLTPQQISQNIQSFNASGKAIQAFDTGKQGDTVRSLNVAVSHLESLRDLGHALQNGDVNAFNAARQNFAKAFGVPAPTNWEAAKSIVADEIAKSVIGGQSAQSDREALATTLRNSSSPQQIEGAISTFQDLLGGQLRGLRQQYKSSTGRDDFNAKLFPHTLSVLDRGAAGHPGGSPLPPQARNALKEGTVTTFGNGQRWTLKGGKPMRVN